jgi:hypothetical protein
MGIRGELFSSMVQLPNRTYFFNVKENRMGDIYLNIVESKNRDIGGFDRQSIVLFTDDLQEFLKGFDESLRVLEKTVREKRRSGGDSPKRGEKAGRGEKTYGHQSGENPAKSRRPDHERKQRPEFGDNYRPDHARKQRPEFGDNYRPDHARKQRPEFGDSHRPDYGRKQKPVYGDSHKPDYGRKQKPVYGDNHKPGMPGQRHEKSGRIVVKKKRNEEF